MAAEKRYFRLDQNAIPLLIQSQAGSLQKAILEAVSNALDAGASQVSVDLSSKRVVIEDDGRGFKSKKELDEFFDLFGFDHTNLDRKVGRFGVGRGQLFHFGKNLWTTNSFTMSVDTRQDTFSYDLGTAEIPHKGVRIEIDLYEHLNFTQMSLVESELKKLVKFSYLPVILNGKQVSKDPSTQSWDHDTEDAWIKLDDSHSLKVYSQGLFVQDLPSYRYGKGGVIITKMGHPLKQNLARNDTLITDCQVWKRVEKTLSRLSRDLKKDASKKRTMNEAMRATLASDAILGDDIESAKILCSSPIFTTTNGRHIRLDMLLSSGFVASGPNKDPSADVLMQRKQAMVISERTLSRFGVETVQELVEKLTQATDRYIEVFNNVKGIRFDYRVIQQLREIRDSLDACEFFENVQDLPMRSDIQLVEVKPKELTKEERIALSIIRRSVMPPLSALVWNHLHPEDKKNDWAFVGQKNPNVRLIQLAVTESAHACTDGLSKIWIDRQFLRDCMSNGAPGFISLANVLVHELLHDFDTSIGHDHDHDFYQAYHDITSGPQVANVGFSSYRYFLARGGPASAYSIKEMERGQMVSPKEVDERSRSLANPDQVQSQVDAELGLEPQPAAVAAAPRRRAKP